ncbi:MAG: DivIVA domain-containing protein [Candidatus Marinimicrobia bacterium]|nr:DivIVA domain-containing protein [Candidatus Neomarinimicrobiota bacterium]
MIQPRDILEREFKKSFHGYDPVEVRYFLQLLAEEIENLNGRVRELEPLEKEIDAIRAIQPEKILQEAAKKAEQTIRDAEDIAHSALQGATAEKEKIETEIQRLKHQRNKLIRQLESVHKNQAKVIEFLTGDDDKTDNNEQNIS